MNDNKIKIVIISHALVIPAFQSRWKQLAKDERYDVHLIVPRYWEQTWFGEKVVYEPTEVHEGNFHVHPVRTTNCSNWTNYFFVSPDMCLKKINPDVIYIVHEEMIWVHQQIYLYKKLFAPKAKIVFFSMHALGVPNKKLHQRWRWRCVIKNTNAAIVHYPGCLDSLKGAGYENPIFLQTQVGVDETLFSKKLSVRHQYRETLNIQDKFVIGYVGRITNDKGVWDLYNAFKNLVRHHSSLFLLLVGNGDLKDKIEADARKNNIDEQIHITGFVDQTDVPNYLNAMDIFALCSKTTLHWIDTFPLVTVQAQACKVPVIASNSASLPWQLADTALFFNEGNVEDLSSKIDMLYKDTALQISLKELAYNRVIDLFCITGMTENFKEIINQVITGDYEFHEESEPYKQNKAY